MATQKQQRAVEKLIGQIGRQFMQARLNIKRGDLLVAQTNLQIALYGLKSIVELIQKKKSLRTQELLEKVTLMRRDWEALQDELESKAGPLGLEP